MKIRNISVFGNASEIFHNSIAIGIGSEITYIYTSSLLWQELSGAHMSFRFEPVTATLGGENS